MPLSELTAAERHRRIAGDFTRYVRHVTDWDARAPVAGWTARDVVDHLITWLSGLLAAGGVELPTRDGARDDPVTAWVLHAEAVQALLDDPHRAAAPFAHPQAGSMPVADAVDRLYSSDVFMHTWDLARADGQVPELEPQLCDQLLAGMEPVEHLLRASGHYGPRVEVAADADAQTRLIGFIGRDPDWRPDPPRGGRPLSRP